MPKAKRPRSRLLKDGEAWKVPLPPGPEGVTFDFHECCDCGLRHKIGFAYEFRVRDRLPILIMRWYRCD